MLSFRDYFRNEQYRFYKPHQRAVCSSSEQRNAHLLTRKEFIKEGSRLCSQAPNISVNLARLYINFTADGDNTVAALNQPHGPRLRWAVLLEAGIGTQM